MFELRISHLPEPRSPSLDPNAYHFDLKNNLISMLIFLSIENEFTHHKQLGRCCFGLFQQSNTWVDIKALNRQDFSLGSFFGAPVLGIFVQSCLRSLIKVRASRPLINTRKIIFKIKLGIKFSIVVAGNLIAKFSDHILVCYPL